MRTRDVYLARDETLPDSGLKYIKLDVSHPISQLVIEFEATTGSTSCTDHELHDDISSIEVIDGSDVLFSLSGKQMLGIAALTHRRLPPQVLTEAGGATQKETFIIDFGRFLYDPEYALDPKKFTNPQLAITYALTISATAGFATGTGKLTVVARCMEEGYGPIKGFLMTKAHYPFTAVQNQEYAIDLPRDYPYRLLCLQALLDDNGIADCVDRLELSINNDAWVPYKLYADELKYFQREWFGIVRQQKTVFRADDASFHTDIFEPEEVTVRTTEDDHIVTVEAVDQNKVTVGLYDLSSPDTPAFQTTAKSCVCNAEGYMVSGLIGLPFGDLNDPDDWLPAQKQDAIKLKFKALAAFAGDVIIQQPRS